jgi:hypothetical protein
MIICNSQRGHRAITARETEVSDCDRQGQKWPRGELFVESNSGNLAKFAAIRRTSSRVRRGWLFVARYSSINYQNRQVRDIDGYLGFGIASRRSHQSWVVRSFFLLFGFLLDASALETGDNERWKVPPLANASHGAAEGDANATLGGSK